MRKTPPCYNCEKRYLGCHDYCNKYQEFRLNRNHLLKEQRKNGLFVQWVLSTRNRRNRNSGAYI